MVAARSDPALRRLAAETLRRQFPEVGGPGPGAGLRLFEQLGPVQSQVPRTPFLTAASRLPGVAHADVAALLADGHLVKASTLRGTVHVSTPGQHGWSAAVSTAARAVGLRRLLGVEDADVARLTAALEEFCADRWCTREEVVAYATDRLDRSGPPPDGFAGYAWGHPRLLRAPTDGVWERRTDTLRRTADGPRPGPAEARRELVRVHLRAYGPATRRDLAWWLGDPVTAVDQAVTALGAEVVPTPGPGSDPLLDLADPPQVGCPDPGVRLLPEFDGVLLGFHPSNRDRFLDPDHLPSVWNRRNGLFAPLVLAGGRIAGSWRTTRPQRRTAIEIRRLPGTPRLTESDVADAVTATATALALEVTDVRLADHEP